MRLRGEWIEIDRGSLRKAVRGIGVEPVAAHMFAFYFGVVSTITPPVALAAFAAAAIAKTPPMATAIEATRVGIAKFLVPLIFVYNPALLFVGPAWFTAVSATLALAGLWVLSMGLEGWCRGRLNVAMRAALIAGAVLILFPPNHHFLGIRGYWLVLAGTVLSGILMAPRFLAESDMVPGGRT